MDSTEAPLVITVPEFMRRMKEMQMTGGGGMMGMGDFPDMYDLIVNANHPLASKILDTEDAESAQFGSESSLRSCKASTKTFCMVKN